MLAGKPPFGSGAATVVVQRQLNDKFVAPSQLRPDISSAVDDVLRKALDPTPKKRWTSAGTFAIALARALDRPADAPAPSSEPPPPPRTVSREVKAPSVDAQVEALLAPATVGLATAALGSGAKVLRSGNSGLIPSLRTSGLVRAAHLRVLSRLLQHHLGESGVAKLIGDKPALAPVLAPTLAPLSWVELTLLVDALEVTRQAIPSPVLPRKVGRGAIEATFAHLFGADPKSLAAETVVGALPTFWPRYHDWGPLTVDIHPALAIVTLGGYPGSTGVCAVVGAQLERIVELTGTAAVAATHAACACTGASACEFRISWAPNA
jgi:hypothetical protein